MIPDTSKTHGNTRTTNGNLGSTKYKNKTSLAKINLGIDWGRSEVGWDECQITSGIKKGGDYKCNHQEGKKSESSLFSVHVFPVAEWDGM